jgi:hypothetical protein
VAKNIYTYIKKVNVEFSLEKHRNIEAISGISSEETVLGDDCWYGKLRHSKHTDEPF